MTLGIYTLSKTKPFSENIQGLEQSVQARYNAQTGVEVARLIYSEDSKKRTLSLDDADSSNDDFTPVDGSVVQNRTSVVIDPNRPKQQTNASEDLFSTEGSGVETIISSTTEIIPQACSGNAEIVHQPKEDGGCVYWNKLEP